MTKLQTEVTKLSLKINEDASFNQYNNLSHHKGVHNRTYHPILYRVLADLN